MTRYKALISLTCGLSSASSLGAAPRQVARPAHRALLNTQGIRRPYALCAIQIITSERLVIGAQNVMVTLRKKRCTTAQDLFQYYARCVALVREWRYTST